MLRLEHIGIAVSDLNHSIQLYERLLNTGCYKTETVEREKVKTAFFSVGNTKVELLESLTPEGVINRFVASKGEGLHHIAFEVEDIHSEIQRLQQEGFTIIDPVPREGADNKLICFVHPKTANGVLIELCQERG